MDDSLVTDAAVVAWKQVHTLIEAGASDEAIDEAMRAYIAACRQQMACKGLSHPQQGSAQRTSVLKKV